MEKLIHCKCGYSWTSPNTKYCGKCGNELELPISESEHDVDIKGAFLNEYIDKEDKIV